MFYLDSTLVHITSSLKPWFAKVVDEERVLHRALISTQITTFGLKLKHSGHLHDIVLVQN